MSSDTSSIYIGADNATVKGIKTAKRQIQVSSAISQLDKVVTDESRRLPSRHFPKLPNPFWKPVDTDSYDNNSEDIYLSMLSDSTSQWTTSSDYTLYSRSTFSGYSDSTYNGDDSYTESEFRYFFLIISVHTTVFTVWPPLKKVIGN